MDHKAVDYKPYSCLYVNMNSKNVDEMFYMNVEKSFKVSK